MGLGLCALWEAHCPQDLQLQLAMVWESDQDAGDPLVACGPHMSALPPWNLVLHQL